MEVVCTSLFVHGKPWTRKNAKTAITNVLTLFCDILLHINLLTQVFLQKLENAHRIQCGRLYVLRTVGLLALPLVCHLVGITNGNHPTRKAFIEHGGKPFSCDCMWFTCIFIVDMTNTRSCCSHPACFIVSKFCGSCEENIPCRTQQTLSLIWPFPARAQRLHETFLVCPEQILMHNLPLGLQSVGYFLLPQVQLGNKRFLHWSNQTPQDISRKVSDFELHRSESHEP